MRIVFGLSTIAVVTKVFGFAEKFVIAHFFGTGPTADVYFAATGIVLSMVWLVKELVNPSLLPVFSASLHNSPGISGGLFRKMFLATAGLLALATVLIAALAPLLTRILVPGFTGLKLQMACRLLRMLAPAVLFLGVSTVTYTVLNAHKRFIQAVCPEAVFKLVVVVGLIVLLPVLDIYALAVVMGLGGLCCLLMQLSFVPERHLLLRRDADRGAAPAFHKVGLLMGPLVVGVVFSHVNGLVDNVLASTLPAGQLSFLGYAKKLIDALLLIGPVALTTVVYSQLSHLASARDHQGFIRLVRGMSRLLIYLTAPAACAFVVLRHPLISLLFQRGQFGDESVLGTSRAFVAYAAGLTVFSLETLLVHSFFAMSDTKTPIKIGILCSLVDVALALALLRPLQYLGIAWAFVVARTLKVVLLAIVLDRRCAGALASGLVLYLLKIALSTLAVWAALRLALAVEHPGSFIHTLAFDLVLPAGGAVCAFAVCSHLLRIEEFTAAWTLIVNRRAAVKTMYKEAR